MTELTREQTFIQRKIDERTPEELEVLINCYPSELRPKEA